MTLSLETAGRGVSEVSVRRPLRAMAAPVAMIGLLAIWTLVLHIPSRGARQPDDGFYLEVARLWLSGAPPYLSVFDVKPPGFFALLALAESVFGASQSTLNGLTIACETGAAFCLWRLGRQLAGPSVGVFAAVAFPLLSQMLASNPAYPALALATTAAFALAVAPFGWWARVGLAGLAMGLAFTMKQTACLEALALAWLLVREPEAEGNRLRTALGFAAAAAAPSLAFAFVLAAQGALTPLFADVVVTALHRPALESETAAQILDHFVAVQTKIWPLVVVAALGVARYRTLLPAARMGRAEGLVLWFAASWLELLLQHARWVIYLGPTVAPLLLLAGAATAAAIRAELVRRVALATLLLATFCSDYRFRIWNVLEASDEAAVAAAAPAIRARNPGPSDRLLAILLGENLNVVTGLEPPTRYFNWIHLVCDFPGAGFDRLREALAAAPRFLVIPTHPFRPYCEDPRAWPLIHAALAQNYRRIAQAPAEAPQLEVYERSAAR